MKERKPPARGGFTPSETPAGRRRFEAQKEVPPSAEGGKRNFLKKVSFETSKTFPLLLSYI